MSTPLPPDFIDRLEAVARAVTVPRDALSDLETETGDPDNKLAQELAWASGTLYAIRIRLLCAATDLRKGPASTKEWFALPPPLPDTEAAP